MLEGLAYPVTHTHEEPAFLHIMCVHYMKSHDCLSKPPRGEADEDRPDMNFIMKLVILVLDSNIISR